MAEINDKRRIVRAYMWLIKREVNISHIKIVFISMFQFEIEFQLCFTL